MMVIFDLFLPKIDGGTSRWFCLFCMILAGAGKNGSTDRSRGLPRKSSSTPNCPVFCVQERDAGIKRYKALSHRRLLFHRRTEVRWYDGWRCPADRKEVDSVERPILRETMVRSDLPAGSAEKATWRDYLTLTKPGINASNLMAAFAGFWLAGHGQLDLPLLLITLLGTALVIAGGCALNNVIDRDIDPLMSRTQSRPVASGRVRPMTALWVGIALTVAGFVVLAALVNPLAAFLAMIGHFVYVGIYSLWLKRTTTLNTVVGGISGAVPPMIGWVAVTGSIDPPAWILFIFMFLWQPPHFLALAIRRMEE